MTDISPEDREFYKKLNEAESKAETLARLRADVDAECQAIRDQAAREQNREAGE